MACVASNAGPQPKENQIVSEPAATVVLETLPEVWPRYATVLAAWLSRRGRQTIGRLGSVRLVYGQLPKQPRAEARAVRLPYADDSQPFNRATSQPVSAQGQRSRAPLPTPRGNLLP